MKDLVKEIDDLCVRLGKVGCEIVDLNEDQVREYSDKMDQLSVQMSILHKVIRGKYGLK